MKYPEQLMVTLIWIEASTPVFLRVSFGEILREKKGQHRQDPEGRKSDWMR